MPFVPPSGLDDTSRPPATGDQVRVIDAAPLRQVPGAAGRSGVAVLASFAALMVLALWLTGGTAPSASVPLQPEPQALSAEPGAMPDLAGLTVEQAATLLQTGGFAEIGRQWSVVWEASLQPEGEVLAHEPAAGEPLPSAELVQIVVSEGQPVVRFFELPPDVRAFASQLPGFDPTAPVLARPTAAGTAYKTDNWLFGECAAVELAYRSFVDASYLEDCFVRETVSVTGMLIDGTGYQVWGLPPGDYPAPAPSGVIVHEDASGAQALGVTTYGPSVVGSDVTASAEGNVLTFAAGRWRSDVAIHPTIFDDPDRAASLAGSVHPQVVDGHLVVGLDPPLRWQRPGELPSRIEADYGSFRVVAGCFAGAANVTCDPSGAISVETSERAIDLSGVAIRLDAVDAAARQMVDPVIGIEWELPGGWRVAADRLTEVTFPREVFAAGTFPMRPGGGRCSHMPENALRDLGPEDVLVAVFAGGGDGQPQWPDPFRWTDLADTGFTDAQECADRPDLAAGIGFYSLDGVPLFVLVAVGEQAAPETQDDVWHLLDSLEITAGIWWTP